MRKLLFIVPIEQDEDFTAWLIACANAGNIKLPYYKEHFINYDIYKNNPMYLRNTVQFLETNSDYDHIPSPEDIIYKHSDIAVNSIFTKAWYTGMTVNTVLNGASPEPFVQILRRKPFRYCPVCAGEDMKKLGRMIVHVPHQILGISACWKHGCTLTEDRTNRTANPADDTEFRKARLAHMIYERRIMGCLEDIADEINKRLLENGMGKRTIKSYSTCSPAALDALTSFFTYEEIVSLCIKGNKRRKESDSSNAETAGMQIISNNGSLLTLKCRDCGKTHYAFSGASVEEFKCIEHDESKWEETMRLRMQPRLIEGLEIYGFPDGRHVDLRHRPCGTILRRRYLRSVMNTGGAVCPFCMEAEHKDHIGEEGTMNCGLSATIVRFNTVVDVDVRFEDGSERKGITYRAFLRGEVLPVGFYQKSHIGEKKAQDCGLECEITRYESQDDMDVRFADGSVRNNVTYALFRSGKLQPKGYRMKKASEKVVGKWRMMNCGQKARIIERRSSIDCDVAFEDGSVRKGVRLHHFLNGELSPENYYEKLHLGETRTMRNGLQGTITCCPDSMHVTVRLSNGDESVVTYVDFCNGYVRSETLEKQRKDSHVGETYRQNCGLDAEIISFMNAFNCVVRFSNGEEREGVLYNKLKNGNVLPPSMQAMNRIGNRYPQSCGQTAEVIADRGSEDLDVRFDNGRVRKHVKLSNLKKGIVKPLNRADKFREEHIGEERNMKCGRMAKITEIVSAKDISVQFETGEVREHIVYANFKSGSVSPTKRE